MKIIAIAAVLTCLTATPALAQTMTVETFLEKADGLKAKGPLALLSSDIGLLQREVQAAGLANRSERLARINAGQKPLACPPERLGMGSDELIAAFRAIPPAQRARITIKEAMADMVRKRYPCPK